MKNKLYVLIILGIILFSGCSDFLDKNPLDNQPQIDYWKSKRDFDMAMASCYGTMANNGHLFSYGLANWESMTDNGYCQHREGQYGLTTDIIQGDINSSTGGFIGDLYGASYSNIARINLFLFQLSQTNVADITEKDKKIYEGEARFLRAFYYALLYKCYGAVPLVTEPLNLETQYQPKSESSKILDFVMEDLNQAIELLGDRGDQATYMQAKGTITSNAARAFKARMLLYNGYDDAGNAILEQMNAALTELNKITGYILENNYIDLFQGESQEKSTEIIFSTKFLAPNIYHSIDLWYGSWIVCAPLTNLVESYEFSDGTPFSKADPRYDIDNPTKNRDTRMGETVSHGAYEFEGVKQQLSDPLPTDYLLRKYLWREKTHIPSYDSHRSDQDFIQMRYAEVLLMIAEAENELRGANQVVYKAINDIRARPSVNLPALPTGLSKDQMREKIRHERRIELAFEGQRYFDLKRWKTIGKVINGLSEPKLPNLVPKYEDRFYLWPLPQSEIDKNKGVLVQNPDY